MQTLGSWLQRKVKLCKLRMAEAKAGLARCGVDIDVLREQWEIQKAAQTKPLPSTSRILCVIPDFPDL